MDCLLAPGPSNLTLRSKCDMHREPKPFVEALSQQLKVTLFPNLTGVAQTKLLKTYPDRLTTYVGVDVPDQTFTALSLDAGHKALG